MNSLQYKWKMKFLLYFCFLFSEFVILYCKPHQTLYEDSTCLNKNNQRGICTQLPKCPEIHNIVRTHGSHNFTTCNFIGLTEVVCCPMLTSIRSPNISSTRISEKACDSYTKDFSNVVFPTIYGGKDAEPGQFPFMAALGLYSNASKLYKFSCGSTIISEKFVVTAAHCVLNSDEDVVKVVRAGVINVPESVEETDPKTDFAVKGAKVHPNYTRKHQLNDIALVELEKPLEFRDDLRPACLFTNGSRYPREFVITGWGAVDENNRKSDVLQRATVYHMGVQDCVQKYVKYKTPIGNNQVCAIHNLSDTCLGDSGGPLVMRESDFPVIVGVTSFGLPGCGPGTPSVYTSISQYLDWIEGIVWKGRT